MRLLFSSRTEWDLHPSPLSSLLDKKRAKGEDILDLTESNPTRCNIPPLPSPLNAEALQRSAIYEPDPKGLPRARKAIAVWYKTQGSDVSPEHLALTTGTSEAYAFLLRLLCNSGDSVALPKPSYPLLDYLCRLNDVRALHFRLAYDGEWHIDFQSLEEALQAGARSVILVHPNNPTGSYLRLEERMRLLDLAIHYQSPLIVDEVFFSFPLEDGKFRAGSFAGTEEVLTFTLNGLSKLVALPQMKLAWIAISGPGTLVDESLGRLEVISDTYLSVSAPIQHAAGDILAQQPVLTARVLNRVAANYASLKKAIALDSPVTLLRNDGGWNAMVRLPSTRSDEAWSLRILESLNVVTHPGHLFDCENGAYLILSLLPEPEIFSEGVRRICSAASS